MSEEVEKRYEIVRSIGEECIQKEELKNLLATKAAPICYDGFKPSGRMHIAQPVRDHFKTDARAKNLLEQIKELEA